MLTSDVIVLHIQKELRKNSIEDLIVNNGLEARTLKFKEVLTEDNEIIIKHQNLINLNFDAYLDKEDFISILNSEVNIEWVRIKEQINNIENLLKAKSQPAWILVSVYYCCFFMMNLISKVYGKSLVNFSGSDLKNIYKRSNTELIDNGELKENIGELGDGSNNVYSMYFSVDDENTIKIQFKKSGDQPHKFTWTNLKGIISNAANGKCGPTAIPNLAFLKKICDSSEHRWPLPSQIRNDWNYSSTFSFAQRGTQIAEDFIRFLNYPQNIEQWESRVRIKTESSEEDKIVSVAYLYHVLKNIVSQLVEQNDLVLDGSKSLQMTAIKAKQRRKTKRKK